MKLIKGKHCANCYHCRYKDGRAWCSRGKWVKAEYNMEIIAVDIRGLSAKHYKQKAKQCPDYEGMEG